MRKINLKGRRVFKLENINIIKKPYLYIQFWKWVSVLSTVTRIRSGQSEFRISVQAKAFPFPQNVWTGTRIHPAFHPKSNRVLSSGVKRPKLQAGYLLPSSTVGKKERSYASFPPILSCR